MDAPPSSRAGADGCRRPHRLPSSDAAYARRSCTAALRAQCGGRQLIVLFHPRAVKPRSRRLPLAVLSLAAVLEGVEEYEIVDGNVDDHPVAAIIDLIDEHDVELLGVSVMPGPQMVAAMEVSREVRRLRPEIRIAWGGYFPSLYAEATLNAKYIDFAVRG